MSLARVLLPEVQETTKHSSLTLMEIKISRLATGEFTCFPAIAANWSVSPAVSAQSFVDTVSQHRPEHGASQDVTEKMMIRNNEGECQQTQRAEIDETITRVMI